MTWKRTLLIVGAALLLWLRPWRRLMGGGAGHTAQPTPDTFAPSRGRPLDSDIMGLAGGLGVAPATAANELAPADEPGLVPPEDAFAGSPVAELPPDFDLDAALDLDDAEPVAAFGAEPEPIATAPSYEDTRPGSVDVPVTDMEPDAELEPELIALGEPEPVEMAEDDLMDVASEPAPVGMATGDSEAADEGERAVGSASAPDDLLIIEGIGPRVSTIVTGAGIRSFAELAAADVDRLRSVLSDAGIKTIDPSTWPEQASIAAEGRWDELRELQRRIKNGKKE